MKPPFFRVILRIITVTIDFCFAQVAESTTSIYNEKFSGFYIYIYIYGGSLFLQVTDYVAISHLTLYIIILIDIMTQRVIITVNIKEKGLWQNE